MVRRKPILLVIFVAVFTSIFLSTRYGYHTRGHLKDVINGNHEEETTEPKKPEPFPCTQHLGWLEPYQFTYPINYVSRDIVARGSSDGNRPQVTIVDEPLFQDFMSVDLADSQTVRSEHCLPPLQLEVPHSSMMKVDASNMIFGMQTTIGRLRDTVKHLARWLPNTGARLYAIVIESGDPDIPADDGEMAALEKEFRKMGMLVTIIHPVRPSDYFAQRYFSLISIMYAARDKKTQWISTIDDDTFFPSMWDLQDMLKGYDYTKQHYLGSLSEDWWAVNHYGFMGFGGAGVMLSLPLAKVIDNHTDDCKDYLRTTAGDISLMDCIYQFSSTKLTHIGSLHQVDMHGDLSGFYESGRQMLSLHHWKEGSAAGYKLEIEKMHLVADICDSCFLQRWQFPKELLLSNGFSITSYPQGHLTGQKPGILGTGVGGDEVDKIDLVHMEHTWGDDINIAHSLAPVRDKLSDEAKIGYKLLDSMYVKGEEVNAPGERVVRQVYFREGGEGGGMKDTVLVLNWRSGGDMLPAPPTPPPEEEEKKEPLARRI